MYNATTPLVSMGEGAEECFFLLSCRSQPTGIGVLSRTKQLASYHYQHKIDVFWKQRRTTTLVTDLPQAIRAGLVSFFYIHHTPIRAVYSHTQRVQAIRAARKEWVAFGFTCFWKEEKTFFSFVRFAALMHLCALTNRVFLYWIFEYSLFYNKNNIL